MSAIFSVGVPGRIFILTDGAAYTPDGVIRWLGRKVQVAASVPFVVTTRGDKALGDKLKRFLCDSAENFGVDTFVASLPDFLSSMQARPEIAEALGGPQPLEALIAGYSPKRGAFRLKFTTYGENAFVLREPEMVEYAGPIDTDPHTFVQGLQPGDTPESWVRRSGLALMEACRHQLGASVDGSWSFCAIGGQIDLTIVTEHGVTVETLRTWQDVVGDKIEPRRMAA